MTTSTDRRGVEWLRRAAEDGTIHTVRVSFGDRLGHWRGKRVPVRQFLSGLDQPMGFCDGMLVCDVSCDIIEETPFTNYGTGYPDIHVWPRTDGIRPAGWAKGEAYVFGMPCDATHTPVGVAPLRVLEAVVQRLRDQGVTTRVQLSLSGRLMVSPSEPVPVCDASGGAGGRFGLFSEVVDGLMASGIGVRSLREGLDAGSFTLELSPAEPLAAAEAAVVAKSALKEVARARGRNAVFMTFSPGAAVPSRLGIGVRATGLSPAATDPTRVAALLAEGRAVLQPSVNAFKLGAPDTPSVQRGPTDTSLTGLSASSEADPFAALAVTLAALGAAGTGATGYAGETHGLGHAATLLGESGWVSDWLGRDYVENAMPLLKREAALFAAAVTDWEIERYWSAS